MFEKFFSAEKDPKLFLRYSLENCLEAFQEKGISRKEKENILSVIWLLLFSENEERVDKTIEEIKENSLYSVWADFSGNRDQMVAMLLRSRGFGLNDLEKIFTNYLLEIFELEEKGAAYGKALEQSDKGAEKIVKKLREYEERRKSQMASTLEANHLGAFFWSIEGQKYDRIKNILADLIPVVFSNKGDFDAAVCSLKRRASQRSTHRKTLSRAISFLKESLETRN